MEEGGCRSFLQLIFALPHGVRTVILYIIIIICTVLRVVRTAYVFVQLKSSLNTPGYKFQTLLCMKTLFSFCLFFYFVLSYLFVYFFFFFPIMVRKKFSLDPNYLI